KRSDAADVPFRDNLTRAGRIRVDWQSGTISSSATTDLLANQRKATPAEACEHVVEVLNKKIDPASVRDAVFLTAGELLMRQPGIVGLHCVTTVNALHYAYQATGNDETRRLMLLQAAAFLPMFREAMVRRSGKLADLRVDRLEKGEIAKDGTKEDAI